LKNGKPVETTVEIGLSSSSQVEIISGLSEGDTVITNTISSNAATQRGAQSQSPFGGFGGGAFRMGR
jgi:macrolide-specific efflux system membrane fusion protein